MSSLTNFGERQALDSVANGATLYAALFTGAPGEGGGGTEVAGGSYARALMAFSAAATDGGGVTTASNSDEVLFTEATASWGTITHVALFDASSGGNMVWYGTLAAERTVGPGDQFRFAAGSVVLSMA
jgi:hypothetical protein